MFTPNELKEIKFDKAVFGGYDAQSVDKAFAAVCEDFATLFKENTMLKKKLKLLADTVEDYRSVDESMRKALITAQNMANEMVADAEKKSKEMLENASIDAKSRIRELTVKIEEEEQKLLRARTATAEFIDNMMAMFNAENEKFAALKSAVAPKEEKPKEEAPAVKMSDTLEEISKSLEEKVRLEDEEIARNAESAAEKEEKSEDCAPVDEDADMKKVTDTIPFESNIPTEEEMAALEAAAEKPQRRRKIEFENLKFGTSYDIKNED